MPEPPQFPNAEYVTPSSLDSAARAVWIDELTAAPALLRDAVAGLDETALSTKYRNWTIRQIVHHLADVFVNAYMRWHWALTEDAPLIKAYDQTSWAELADGRDGPIELSLALYESIHARLVHLLGTMSDDDFARTFNHPETGEAITLAGALAQYAWHGRHHLKQIHWVREHRL